MDDVATIFKAFGKLSQIKQLNDQCFEYEQTNRKRCGSCNHWMTSSCPRETQVKGRPYGPSMNECACDKFQLNEWVKNLKEKRRQAVVKRFKELQLAIPEALKENSNG